MADGSTRPPLYLRVRLWVQFSAAFLVNALFLYDLRGICVPVLNCWACPVASFACPMGAFQHGVAAMRGALLRVLRRGREAVPALTDAGETGLLSALLPQWGGLRGAPQRNPLHRYDLDTHLVETVAELGA
ncbi:MAG: hypothetical protein ACLFU7_14915, partial [Armatimonadota bacterium]